MKRPLVFLTPVFILGLITASLIKLNFFLVSILVLLFLASSFVTIKKTKIFNLFLLILVFLLGFLDLKNAFILPANHISGYFFKQGVPYTIKGVVDSEPQFRDQRLSFIFRTQGAQLAETARSCSGKIIVHVKGKTHLYYGDELLLYGNLYRPFGKGTNGRSDYRHYLRNQGIFFIMNVKNDSGVKRLNKNKGFPLKRLSICLKNIMESAIFKHASAITAGVLDAMILGEKRGIPWFVSQGMMKTGTIHILVVSGFNVGITVFVVILLLRILRVTRTARFYITIPCLLVYCLITGASTPVVRATVMAIVFILAALLKREPDIYNSLSMAAIFILAFNPLQLFDIGFQLSFASVASIVYLYPWIRSFLRVASLKNSFFKLLADTCLVSFAAWIGTFWLIAYYFKIFSPVTVLANIIIVPLATLITLSGFSMILMPPLAPSLSLSCEAAVLFLLKANAALIKLPAAYFHFH